MKLRWPAIGDRVSRARARAVVEASAQVRRLLPHAARLWRSLAEVPPVAPPKGFPDPFLVEGLGSPRLRAPPEWYALRALADQRDLDGFLLESRLLKKREAQPLCSVVIPVFNKHFLTYRCLRTLLAVGAAAPFEVVVADDGSSDLTAELLEAFGLAIKVVRNPQNLGFVSTCNAGAAVALGKYLVFLNNDTEVTPGWLDALVGTFTDFERVGAVGGKLIYPDGRLQEAGGVVFQDGSAANFGNRGSPDAPAASFAREVDYCSAACLAVRRDLFEQLGGFDQRYAPAFYEDTDLCFGLRQLGHRVIYQPASEVVHYEGATAGKDLTQGIKRFQEINARKFAEKWAADLASQARPGDLDGGFDRARGPRVLMVDHRVPHVDEDSGSVRASAISQLLVRAGCRVSFMLRAGQRWDRHAAALGALGVRVLPEGEAFSSLAAGDIDLVIISRHDVAELFFERVRRAAPHTPVVFDTVDLHFLRLKRASALFGDIRLAEESERARKLELHYAGSSAMTVVVSDVDRQALLKENPSLRVEVVPNIHRPREAAGHRREERTSLLFVGGFSHLPNTDAVAYFAREILPLVRKMIGPIQLEVVGSRVPREIMDLEGEGVRVVGHVPDLGPYYDRARVVVVPLRYGAGMKGKVGEAMAHGVPVVTTSIGAEGMGLTPGLHALIADGPGPFAEAVRRAWSEPELWEAMSRSGRALVAERFSPEAVAPSLEPIVRLAATRRSDGDSRR